ncbi:DNA polymerase I [Patescibacteria group bacterium]|nr:DNA polymerase I [Patescibacteria group bacterium]
MKQAKKLVLIDGSSLIHRAFHALSQTNLTSPNGELVTAVYGFALMLINIYTKLHPEYIVVAFDTKAPTFRHEEYKEYKATRIKAPQELYDQIPRIRELIEAFNIPLFLKDGFEADDVIGTLAKQAPEDIDVYIATSDMDALQLVNKHIFVYAPRKSFSDIVVYTPAEVLKSKGLKPEQFTDFKGLRGDPSDNIPGVPGIGEIGAKKLLQEYKTMENVYKHLDKLPPRIKELLVTHKKQALESKRLATLVTVPIKLDLKKAVSIEFDVHKVSDLFYKLGFKSLVGRIPNGTINAAQVSLFSDSESTKNTNKSASQLTEKLDRDLEPILRKMEKNGILLDTNLINKLNKKISSKLKTLTQSIYRLAKKEFNINSPSQLADILYVELKLPTTGIKKIKTGYSTAVNELEKLVGKHKIIEHIFKYRELEKIRNTYLETLPKMVDKNNRIHTHYAQDTSTGRLSSSNPNLQNIPIRSDLGNEIRNAFIVPKGYTLMSADYSQIELRIIASLVKDQKMIDSFNKGEDIHTRVAAEINNIPLTEVTKQQRNNAKTVNFSIIYGVSPYGLSLSTGMDAGEASQYLDKYFALHPSIKNYMDSTVAFAKKHGYVETWFGRRRDIPEIHSPIFPVRNAAQRAAINMPIQGTAADIIKTAMIKLDKKLPKVSIKSKVLLQIHDELVLEVPNKDVKKVAKLVEDVMENVCKLDVPIVVNIKSGSSWGTTHPINNI